MRRLGRMTGGSGQAVGLPDVPRPSPDGASGRGIGSSVAAGAAAGLLASVVQVVVGKTEQWLFLPRGETPDFAPRLVDRAFQRVSGRASAPVKWALGTVFHLCYGALWGATYGAVQRRLRLHPLLAGAALGLLIYGITFPRWGAAVRLGVERPPHARTRRMTAVAASVAMTYGLAVGAFYRRLAGR
ncbi:MAG: hypothetical protein DIU52_002430 [bacterium]